MGALISKCCADGFALLKVPQLERLSSQVRFGVTAQELSIGPNRLSGFKFTSNL